MCRRCWSGWRVGRLERKSKLGTGCDRFGWEVMEVMHVLALHLVWIPSSEFFEILVSARKLLNVEETP